jgi:hypothetical protein
MAETKLASVFEAFAAAMEDVKAIEKADRNTQQNFSFRGIDAVMQAVGPVLRKHKVFIIPTAQDIRSETYQTRSGASMRNVTVTMRYTVYGPGGDSFTGVSYGEAADAGDKAVSKAQSVAYRTFLLQSLTVPTGDPDPDSYTHERLSPPIPEPPNPELEKAIAELGDACAGLGLNHQTAAGQFFAKYKHPARQGTVGEIREFIESLHDTAAAS